MARTNDIGYGDFRMMKSISLLIVTVFLLVGCGKSNYQNVSWPLILEYNKPSNSAFGLDSKVVVCLEFTGDRSSSVYSFRQGLEHYFERYAPWWSLECDNLSANENKGETLLNLSVNVRQYDESNMIAVIAISSPAITYIATYSIQGESVFSDAPTSLSTNNYNLAILTAKSILNRLSTIKEFSELVRVNNEKRRLIEEQQQAEEARKLLPEVSDKETDKLYNNIIKAKHVNKIAASIEAYRLALSNGYRPTHLPSFSSSIIVLDDQKTKLTPTTTLDLPLKRLKLKKNEVSGKLDKTGRTILVQPISSNVKRYIHSQSKVKSTYIAGYSEEHNYAYDVAYRNYQSALNELRIVRAEISSQSAAPFDAIGISLKLLANGTREYAALSVVEQAEQKLAQTPQTISTPIKKEYSYNVMQVKVSKSIHYNLYIIHKAKGTVRFKKYSKSAGRTFKLQYDKHTKDTGHSTYDSESSVEDYEKQSLTFSLDDIVDDLVATKPKGFKSRPYTNSLSFIAVPTKPKKQKVQKSKAVNGKLSGLMQSVVAIQDNGGSTIGTGFFINANLILTNRHVVGERKLISVRTKGGLKYVGKVLDTHYDLDIALVEVDGTGTPVKIYSGSSATEGEEVIAIGNPIGLEYSVTKGIISSIRKRKDKKKPLSKEYRYIQTDVAINPGNSGGPLFMNGKVVGINTSKMVDENIEGIGFAIHYDEILGYLDDNEVKIARVKNNPVVKPVKKKSKKSPEDEAERKLTRLKKMFDKGLITEDEYKSERAEVLEKF